MVFSRRDAQGVSDIELGNHAPGGASESSLRLLPQVQATQVQARRMQLAAGDGCRDHVLLVTHGVETSSAS